MNFKKRVNGSWHDIPHYVHKTDTDILTTLPADIYPAGTTATVGLKGQTVQSGTPTLDNPIMPQGTGERTGNLAPPLLEWINGYVASNGYVAAADETYKEKTSDYISIDAGKAYTFSMQNGFPGGTNYSWRAIGWYAQDKTFISRASSNTNVALSTNAPLNAAYCRLSYRTHGETTNPMFNSSSTALPYEPYGVKIPISSANTTTPVYLGEVQTTRKIKKLVFDGTEKWYTTVSSTGLFGIQRFESMHAHPFIPGYSAISNCYVYNPVQSGIDAATVSGEFALQAFRAGSTWQYNFFIKDGRYDNINSFISYLAAQYAAGTPVTVWYVLAEPETGIVNEPLMKIGDYADTVSGISIPTIAGANTLSVDTTLQPSEVTVNYKGWHPIQNVHEAENGQWD